MDNEKDIIEAEVEEKETVEAEILHDEIEVNDNEFNSNPGFDPNVVLNTIMQSQNPELRNTVLKLSTLNTMTKITVICLLACLVFKFPCYIAFISLVYGIYCAIYVLLHYDQVKSHEHMIKDVMSKGEESVNIKKTVWKNLIISLICVPLLVFVFWYWHFYVV